MLQTHPGARGQAGPTTGCSNRPWKNVAYYQTDLAALPLNEQSAVIRPNVFPLHDVNISDDSRGQRASRIDRRRFTRRQRFRSGRKVRSGRPKAFKLMNRIGISRTALRADQPYPSLFSAGGARRDRTDDLMLAKHALSQLSYGPRLTARPNPFDAVHDCRLRA